MQLDAQAKTEIAELEKLAAKARAADDAKKAASAAKRATKSGAKKSKPTGMSKPAKAKKLAA